MYCIFTWHYLIKTTWPQLQQQHPDGRVQDSCVSRALEMEIQQFSTEFLDRGAFQKHFRSHKFSPVNKICIFHCMGKIFCVEFQREPLKFHTKYFTHTLKDMFFMWYWNFKSSYIWELIHVFETPPLVCKTGPKWWPCLMVGDRTFKAFLVIYSRNIFFINISAAIEVHIFNSLPPGKFQFNFR